MAYCQIFMILIISLFPLVLSLIDEMYQTLETVFCHTSKCIETSQKYAELHAIFSTLFSVFGNVERHSHLCLIL